MQNNKQKGQNLVSQLVTDWQTWMIVGARCSQYLSVREQWRRPYINQTRLDHFFILTQRWQKVGHGLPDDSPGLFSGFLFPWLFDGQRSWRCPSRQQQARSVTSRKRRTKLVEGAECVRLIFPFTSYFIYGTKRLLLNAGLSGMAGRPGGPVFLCGVYDDE